MDDTRKRKSSDVPDMVLKRTKKYNERYMNWIDSVRNKNKSEKKTTAQQPQNVYLRWVLSSRNQTVNPRQENEVVIRGNRKERLNEIKNQEDYVKIQNEDIKDVEFYIRKTSTIVSKNLYSRETNYDVEVQTHPELEGMTLPGFISSLWDVLAQIYSDCLELKEYDEICIHATHRELEGSLSSSIFELKEENQDRIIYEIMSRITGWNQSSKPGAAVKHLKISVTLLRRNIPGNGVLLAIGDDNLRKKAFSKENFNGSIFYVDTVENCFYVSIYFGLAYNRFTKLFTLTKNARQKKNICNAAYQLFKKKGAEVEEAAKAFFQEFYQLDIANFESGSEYFLKELARKANVQVSIFSDSENYKRILMIPEVYDPFRDQVNVLLTQYLLKTEPRKTVRKEEDFVQFHYHGIKSICRGFTGQGLSFCVHCGIYHSYLNAFHSCKKSELLCEVCLRPQISDSLYEKMTATVQTNFCLQTPNENLECIICKKNAKTSLCLEIHNRQKCQKKIRCKKCTRVIKLVGKYSLIFRQQKTDCHENCEEVFCHICQDYVLGYDDLKNPTHVCFVTPITETKNWPSLIVAFDFETYPCDENGTMKTNMIHMIYQEESYNTNADFKGIFFTDIPSENVELNGQLVYPGIEYTPDLHEDLKNYIPESIRNRKKEENQKLKEMKKNLQDNIFEDDEPYDSKMCHFLRNPEIPVLTKFNKVKTHLDIFEHQLVNKIEIPSVNITHNTETSKKFDWRKELEKLERKDAEIVDKMKFARYQETEEEAIEADKIYTEKLTRYENRRKQKKKCTFIDDEAGEDSDKESLENYNSNEDSPTKMSETLYNTEIPEPETEGGEVPGYSCRKKTDELDYYIKFMSKSENVQQLRKDCSKINVYDETESTPNTEQMFKKFCSHETETDYKKRLSSYKKSLGKEKSNCLKQFALYILQPKFRNAVFLGMYSSGFDNHFIFLQLMELGVRVNPVFKGNKLLTFSIPALNIRFLDFFCYVPSSLKNLEKSFNLKTGSKGYFPHILNKPENYGLTLPHLPPKHFYEPEMMKTDELNEFEKWYNQNFYNSFTFAQEILTYCEQDVKILMAASLTFLRETLSQQTEFVDKVQELKSNSQSIKTKDCQGEIIQIAPSLVHAFSEGLCTLSSYVNTLFRSFYLEARTLPIVSHDVEEKYSTQSSKLELEVMTYLKEVEEISDLEFGDHYRGQKRFTVVCPDTQKARTFYVDGYSPSTQTVVEFLGCVFHGCEDCFSPNDKLKIGVENYDAVRLTRQRINLLKLHNDVKTVRVIRECDWKKRVQADPRVMDFVKNFQVTKTTGRRMSLKETFRGGLVEPLCVAVDAEKVNNMVMEKYKRPISNPYGQLIDINSMYPAQLMPSYSYSTRDLDYVMCPVRGHKTLRGTLQCTQKCDSRCQVECRRYDKHVCSENSTCYKTCNEHHGPDEWGKLPGFALVKILPPRHERFPILRMKLSDKRESKNFSTLCRTCAIEGDICEGLKVCTHSDEERCIEGEFTTAELKYAIDEQGYKVLQIYEVQFYPEYSLTMFQNLLKSFYMMKVASKGFPNECLDQTSRLKYLESLRADCGFGNDLKLEYIQKNEPRVTVSKLSANALVGKLGQSQNRLNKKVVTEHKEIVDIRNSKYYTLAAVKLINERTALISYRPLEDRIRAYKLGCLVVPSQVTAYSRIYLTRLAKKFEANNYVVAYCDTDSLLTFPIHPDAVQINQICQISDRLGCLKVEKDYICKFFSTAAKTYSLQTIDDEVTIKAKGFRLLEKLLKDNSEECLLEKSILKTFSEMSQGTKCNNSSTLVFQKQIRVNSRQMVPALQPNEKSYKALNFIGPRRQIDLQNWLDFQYDIFPKNEYVKKIDPRKPLIIHSNENLSFECNNLTKETFEIETEKEVIEKNNVQLQPIIKAILPALPYGYCLDNLKEHLCFYNLL